VLIGDVSGGEWADEEADREVADDRWEPESARKNPDQARDEKDDADLEDGNGLLHGSRLIA